MSAKKAGKKAKEEPKKKSAKYDADSITALKGLEPVRKRPAMYIGTTSSRGLHHLVYEVVDNSVDEAIAGHCKNIVIKVLKNQVVEVSDDGRGIPVGMHKDYKNKTALEVVMTVLHAGGKFDSDSYAISGGLHGVGISVVNALSEWLEVEVKSDGKLHYQKYKRGKPQGKVVSKGKATGTGTKVRFFADKTIFNEIKFKSDTLKQRIKELAYLNAGLSLRLIHEGDGFDETYKFDGGLTQFVKDLVSKHTPVHSKPIIMSKDKDLGKGEGTVKIEGAFMYTDSYTENIFSFANNINTHEGGTHLTGVRTAFTRVINDYAKKNNLLDKGKSGIIPLDGDDCREGLYGVIHAFVPEPQFEGQTKTKLGNSEIKGVAETMCNEALSTFLEENPTNARKIIVKAVTSARARAAAKKAKDLTRRKSALEISTLPGKLSDCSMRSAEDTELYIVEGDSAGGSAKQGRDRQFQAILPLRGKILNVEKARMDKILGNEEIKHIVTALGCGIGTETMLMEKLRYHHIIIMTDADVDGAHIRTLLLTFFFRYMRPLIEHGYLYIAQPPLYAVKFDGKVEYAFDEEELEKLKSRVKGKSLYIQRYKGLGEMNPEQLWETTMDPQKRMMLQVKLEDEVSADAITTTLMGNQVEPRREFIEKYAKEVTNLDV